MVIDDTVVVTAELEGMRRLARLPRPKIEIVHEDLLGASCHWSQRSEQGGHRDLVRLRPGSGVPLTETLRAIKFSNFRQPGGHLELRAAEASIQPETDLLHRLGGRENRALPRALMARLLDRGDEELTLPSPELSIMVAEDAESLRRLRSVVGQAFAGSTAEQADQADVEADFYHAPGVMTYLAVSNGETVISTGSLLVVDRVANIWSVATLPSARGQGAATAIMIGACREARRQGAVVAALRTTDELARPDGLYQRIGFASVGHERIWNLDDVDRLTLG